MGTKQDKSCALTVRLTEDLHGWLEEKAKREMRPTANMIAWILNEYRERETSEEQISVARAVRRS
jgi:predicted transcriptional regulator